MKKRRACAGFEYNDFAKPEVYENDAEIRRLAAFYSAQPRDRGAILCTERFRVLT